jgi:four helix bundle protein
VYRLSEAFPKSEQFGPLRSAATSVALNVAEGKGRESDRDLAKFLYRSSGSRLEPDLGEGV